jgi:DNA-binding CsgD family transcriptional regulator
LRDLLVTDDLETARRTVSGLIEQLGFGGYAFGLVWGSGAMLEGSAILTGGNMDAFIPAYLDRGLVSVDRVTQALRTSRAPIVWDTDLDPDVTGLEASTRKQVRSLMDAFGIDAGVSIPVDVAAIGCRAALSVTAATGMSRVDFHKLYASHGGTLHLTALALSAAFGARLCRPRDVSLSENERHVLEALTDGLRPREIARKFEKSEHTIRNQIASAQHRLGARTKEQALVTAARLGLIEL